MIAWRICKHQHVSNALSGIGAEKYCGRWNHKGDRMVYMSSSLSLATLELFVNLDPGCVPIDLYSVAVTLPNAISSEEITAEALPMNWRVYPAPTKMKELGSKWLHEMRSCILIVPSAVNSVEKNILLNPLHPQAMMITEIESNPFHFDPRMWKNSPGKL